MAQVTQQREGATAAPTQQRPSRTTETPTRRQEGTRALLLPVDDTDVRKSNNCFVKQSSA